MALTTEVLPAPERPKSAVMPAGAAKATSRREAAEVVAERHLEAHRAQRPAMRRATRRATNSEASSAAMAMAIETSVSRIAPPSPPGTCSRL